MASFEAEYTRFVENRRKLRARATDLGAKVDAWLAAHPNATNSMRDIAELQGLLIERRRVLFEFVELDDSFISVLLDAKGLGPRDAQ